MRSEIIEVIRCCIQHGDFILHSGQHSTWICDLGPMRGWFAAFQAELGPRFGRIGIETRGFWLVLPHGGCVYKSGAFLPPYVWPSDGRISLLDDVVTTEASLLAATEVIEKTGLRVAEYLCVLDRRKPENVTLEVRSLVTATELGLEA